MERLLNVIAWLTAVSALILGGVVAAAFVLMATSLDPLEALSFGAEPWVNALVAILAFAGLAAGTFLGLKMWHSQRQRILGAVILAVQLALVIYACAEVYAEYV